MYFFPTFANAFARKSGGSERQIFDTLRQKQYKRIGMYHVWRDLPRKLSLIKQILHAGRVKQLVPEKPTIQTGMYNHFTFGRSVLDGYCGHHFSDVLDHCIFTVESLILAQDERWLQA